MKKDHKQKPVQPEKKKEIKDLEEEIVVDQENEIVAMKNKADEYLDGWKRTQAEFENYRKRQAESGKDLLKYATENIILQIIPVLDNFHLATEHIPADQRGGGWAIGIMHIQKQLENVLAENGIEEIPATIGDTFDPAAHEAIEDKECLHCKDKKDFKNKIKKVVLKGYKIGEKIIRPARVVVE